jgi:hypothetical protein
MAGIKTKANEASVEGFLEAVDNPARRADARTVCAMLERVTGEAPKMWGPGIVGFGAYRYRYDSGHEGEMCRIGFSPRKAQLVLYILSGFDGQAGLLARLGRHKTGKGCLYIGRLADVDPGVLEALAARSWQAMGERYPE